MSKNKNMKVYQDIVNENRYRLNILEKYDLILFKQLSLFQYQMKELADSLYNQISLSTNKIRREILKEQMKDMTATYYYSKSRVDRLVSYKSERSNINRLYERLKTKSSDSAYLFITIDYIHTTEYINILSYITTMKNIIKKLLNTSFYKDIEGLFVKYEISFGMYKNKLHISPHIHLILNAKESLLDTLKLNLIEYFKLYIHESENNIDIKKITDNEKSYYNISKYICKDFYTSIFHNKDGSITPYQIIVFISLQTRNFRFINSYKNLNITNKGA